MKYIEIRRFWSSVLVLLLIANIVQAQDIAQIPLDPAVKSGELPNGMKWYTATDPNVKGTADFALVQLTGAKTIPSVGRSTIEAIAQEALRSQDVLTAPSVQDYFIAKGCIPGPDGFAEVGDEATVFRFRHVDLRLSGSVLDSTLLVLMNMAGRYKESYDLVVNKWYTPKDQAIIVTGDVDANVVSEKLRMLSYMFPASESVQRQGYVWKEQPGVKTEISHMEEPGLARVAAVWRMERTPREFMNTIQPAIQEKYMTMAGMVVRERILDHYKSVGKHVASVQCRYEGNFGSLGDGKFTVEMLVPEEDAGEALAVLAGTISSIDAYGVRPEEAGKASLGFSDMISDESGLKEFGNEGYLNRCVSAFIYNTALSSRKNIVKFYSSRDLSYDTESKLLSSVASAALDGGRDLTLEYASDSLYLSSDMLKSIFSQAWQKSQTTVPEPSELRQEPYLPSEQVKVKVKSAKSEYLSGGSVWTLSNGMKIYLKKMPVEDHQIHYCLSMNGGTGNIEGLGINDGKYLSDYLDHCHIGGVSGKMFKDVLRRNGMRMKYEVGHSATMIKGVVPSDRIDYLFRSLLALMNERTAGDAEWGYYLEGEQLRQVAGTASGSGACLSDGFSDKAEEFFRTLSGNVNNGIMILVGDIDEKALKTVLMTYAGGFRTTEKTFTRTQTSSRNLTGMNGSRRLSSRSAVTVSLSAPIALTAENYYTAAVATMVLRRHFARELAGKGMYVDAECECRRFPQESVMMRVSISEADIDGFASGTSRYSYKEAVSVMKSVFDDMESIPVDESLLSTYRYRIERQVVAWKNRPEYWVNALNLRYLGGKDFTTGAEAKINAITGGQVRAMLSTLCGDSKIEYVITGKQEE